MAMQQIVSASSRTYQGLSPGGSAVIARVCPLRGRSTTSGVNRPYVPARTYMPRLLMASPMMPSRLATSFLRRNTDLPLKTKEASSPFPMSTTNRDHSRAVRWRRSCVELNHGYTQRTKKQGSTALNFMIENTNTKAQEVKKQGQQPRSANFARCQEQNQGFLPGE